MNGKRILRFGMICLLPYVVFCLGTACCQRRLIYFPPHLSAQQVDLRARESGLDRWCDASGQPIGMKRLSPKQLAMGQLFVTYGNGSWSVACARYADGIQSVAPFDVYILEYPGYADRPGSPSQDSLFHAAAEAFQCLPTNRPTYVLGESLGSGVAAYLAGTCPQKISGLILVSPYNRLTDVAQYQMPLLPVRLLMLDRFPSEDYLRHFPGPVGVVVDGCDQVVPQKFGQRLYDAYAGPKRLWTFPNEDHMSIGEPAGQFWTEVLGFWQTNSAPLRGSAH
jgi:hypothetical protein